LFGAATTSLAILTVSYDESYGWDEDALSLACMAAPCLFCVGHIITYGALFSKLWRVNKVLQFARARIDASAVAGPLVALLVAGVIILTTWTLHDPIKWVRVEINERTGESLGQCDSHYMNAYVTALGLVVAIPDLMTCVMAWKTKDVDETYSESTWIFSLIVLQLQVIMISVPVVVILRDISTDGRYIGLVLLIWTFPMTTVALLMLPKVFAANGWGSASSSRGGSSRGRSTIRGTTQGGFKVSGLSSISAGNPGRSSHLDSAFESASAPDRLSAVERVHSNGV
jgi:gamma-aminobutyric acid type B receptor